VTTEVTAKHLASYP